MVDIVPRRPNTQKLQFLTTADKEDATAQSTAAIAKATSAEARADSAYSVATGAATTAGQATTVAGQANTTAVQAKTTADTAKQNAAIADLLARAAFDSADIITLSASGVGTFTFTTKYDAEPILRYMVFQSGTGNMPVLVEAVEWVMDADKYAGVKLQGYRAQRMGTMSPISLASLLAGTITGLNTLIAIVSGYHPFGATGFTNVKVHITARTRTLPQT